MSSVRSATKAYPMPAMGREAHERHYPAEWAPHQAVWIGFPGDPAEWPVGLADAQGEVAAFANAVAADGVGEQVLLICRSDEDAERARQLVVAPVHMIVEPFGDIWLRDTGAIVVRQGQDRCALRFGFNGWGGKFDMAGDQDIGERLATRADLPVERHDWILEGGAIDGDGGDWLVTTRQCLLNPNRNAAMTQEDAERRLKEAFGVGNILWLGDGLSGDHTDGHVDNLARFVAPETLLVPQAESDDDPNAAIYADAADVATEAGLIVHRAPSVGRYEVDGDVAPASYMNFYVGNRVVVVPQYGAANDAKALDCIGALLPDREVIGLASTALLRGGGSFHCCSQQIPLL